MGELGVADAAAYRAFLEREPREWSVFDAACRITISRFYRDRRVFEALEREVLPALARTPLGVRAPRCLSVGCASGEEPYTLVLCWMLGYLRGRPGPDIAVTALDSDSVMLARARRACYSAGTLKALPDAWRREAFEVHGAELCLRERFRTKVELMAGDVRQGLPDGPYRLVLCRNLVFTYFEESLQRSILEELRARMLDGAALVIGIHERLPEPGAGFVAWDGLRAVYRKA